LLYFKKFITPEPFRIWHMCLWRFWLRISSGIKSQSSDLNWWDARGIFTTQQHCATTLHSCWYF